MICYNIANDWNDWSVNKYCCWIIIDQKFVELSMYDVKIENLEIN